MESPLDFLGEQAYLSLVPKKRKNPHAVALSRLGAKKGGEARAAKLSAERKAEIARRAAEARWGTKAAPEQDEPTDS
jgi:hypothetical protein